MLKRYNKGFTLIELLIVIAIVGLLASITLVSLSSSREKAKNAQRKAQLKELTSALELYYSQNDSYPSTAGQWWGEPSGFGSHGLTGANGYIPNLAPTYVAKLPHDPNTNVPNPPGYCSRNYVAGYLYRSDGNNYKILSMCTFKDINSNDPMIDPMRDGDGVLPSGCPPIPNSPVETRPYAIAVWSSGALCW
jgi:type II secretion system protein G